MIVSDFVGNVPIIPVTLAWGSFVKDYWFVLDTGFTGDLQIPSELADDIGLTIKSIEQWTVADGSKVNVPQSLVMVSMEGSANRMQAGVANWSPLAGIGFLTKFGYRAIIDTKQRKVILEKA